MKPKHTKHLRDAAQRNLTLARSNMEIIRDGDVWEDRDPALGIGTVVRCTPTRAVVRFTSPSGEQREFWRPGHMRKWGE